MAEAFLQTTVGESVVKAKHARGFSKIKANQHGADGPSAIPVPLQMPVHGGPHDDDKVDSYAQYTEKWGRWERDAFFATQNDDWWSVMDVSVHAKEVWDHLLWFLQTPVVDLLKKYGPRAMMRKTVFSFTRPLSTLESLFERNR